MKKYNKIVISFLSILLLASCSEDFLDYEPTGVLSSGNVATAENADALVTAAYAATDEFHQLFVPGRAGRVTDVLIDSAGAFLALLAIHIILYYHKSEIRNRKR